MSRPDKNTVSFLKTFSIKPVLSFRIFDTAYIIDYNTGTII